MALKVINKISGKLKFLYRENKFLSPKLRRMLCNEHIQPHFDYACPAWHSNITEKMKKKIQIMQNKCMRFCLRLDKMHHKPEQDFWFVNWLPTSQRVDHCINTIKFKFVSNTCPHYLKEIFEFAPHSRIDTKNKFYKLKFLFARQTWGRKLFHSLVLPSGTFYLK